MSANFPPKPGTVAFRVLAHLEAILPRRPRATAGMIAGELQGVTPLQVRDALEEAHAAGFVSREAEVGPTGRGPVFYELVRTTTGAPATGGSGNARDQLRGVIDPVVDPNPAGAPLLEGHAGAEPIGKVVSIRQRADGGADVDIERMPELSAWLQSTLPSDRPSPGPVEVLPDPPPATVSVSLDFANGPDQFAVALVSDGRLHCWRGVVPYVFSRAEARALVDYLNRIDLEPILEGEA